MTTTKVRMSEMTQMYSQRCRVKCGNIITSIFADAQPDDTTADDDTYDYYSDAHNDDDFPDYDNGDEDNYYDYGYK